MNSDFWDNKIILITGAQGFLGSNLYKALKTKGAIIYTVDKETNINSNVDYQLDIESDHALASLSNIGFEYIFHFASPCSIVQYKYERNSHERAIKGFNNIKNFAKEVGAKLVIPSSGSLYSHQLNDYALTKKYFEENIEGHLYYRIFASYGDEKEKWDYASVAYQFAKKAFFDEEIIIYGNGEQNRDFIYIDDVIEMLLWNIEHGLNGNDIGIGRNYSFNYIVRVLEDLLDKKCKIVHVGKPPGYLETTQAFINYYPWQKRRQLSTIETGLKHIINSFK